MPTVEQIDWLATFNGEYADIPDRIKAGMIAYVSAHTAPGDFLRLLICGDINAVLRADPEVLPHIRTILLWFYNKAPGNCHGNPPAYLSWLRSE